MGITSTHTNVLNSKKLNLRAYQIQKQKTGEKRVEKKCIQQNQHTKNYKTVKSVGIFFSFYPIVIHSICLRIYKLSSFFV